MSVPLQLTAGSGSMGNPRALFPKCAVSVKEPLCVNGSTWRVAVRVAVAVLELPAVRSTLARLQHFQCRMTQRRRSDGSAEGRRWLGPG